MDATTHFNKLIAITGDLADLMTEENTALRHRRASQVSALVEQKNALGRAYLAHVHELAKDPTALDQVDAALRERLAGIGERMRGLMEENARLLEAAIATGRRVVDVIAAAVREARPGTYSADGAVGKGGSSAAPLAISVDRSL